MFWNSTLPCPYLPISKGGKKSWSNWTSPVCWSFAASYQKTKKLYQFSQPMGSYTLFSLPSDTYSSGVINVRIWNDHVKTLYKIVFGESFIKEVYLDYTYLTYMQSTSWETLGWRKHKLESRLPVEISITSDRQMTPPLWQKVKKN